METRDTAKRITQQAMAKQSSVSKVNDATNKLAALADKLDEIANKLNANGSEKVAQELSRAVATLALLPSKLSEGLSKSDRTSEVTNALQGVLQALESKDFSPQISVKSPSVVQQNLDVSSIERAVSSLKGAIEASKPKDPNHDDILSGLSSVKNAITGLRFPVPNYILPFRDINGKATQVQLDASGNVPTSGGGGGASGTQYAELITTSPATGTVALGRYKSSVPTLTDGQMYAAQLDASGNLKVNVVAGGAAGGTSSSFGSAIPATGTAVGLSDGTNMQLGRVFDADSGAGTQYVTGTVLRKTASGGSVELGTGTDPIRTDPTGTTAQPVAGDIASGATDSGNPVKVGARYNATKPTFTTGQRGDLQIDSRGNVNTVLYTQDSGQSINGYADNADAVAVTSSQRALAVVNRNTVYNGTTWDRMAGDTVGVNTKIATAISSAVITMQNAVAITGNGTSLTTTGYGTATIQISGTFVATVTFEASVDAGTTWVAISATQVGASTIASTATVAGLYRITCTGIDLIRARVTWTSGTSITVTGRATNAVNSSKIVQLSVGTNSIGRVAIDQTTNIIAGTTMQNAAVAIGNGTNLNVQGYVSAIISLTGTMGASTAVTFEASVDDITFVSIAGHQIGLAGNLAVTTTNTGDFRFNVASYKSVRARISVFGTGSVTAKGFVSTLAGHPTTVNCNIIAALPVGTNIIGSLTANQSVNNAQVNGQAINVGTGTAGTGTQRVTTSTDSTIGTVTAVTAITNALPAGTNTIGDVGIKPRTTGGFTTYHLVSAGSTNAVVVKASAGQVFGWYIYNSNAVARKLVFHNASTTPTAGAAVLFSIVVPPSSGANVFNDIGIAFSTGISITTVTGLADSDAVAVAANDLIINLFYA